jgi:hypothetical protein
MIESPAAPPTTMSSPSPVVMPSDAPIDVVRLRIRSKSPGSTSSPASAPPRSGAS